MKKYKLEIIKSNKKLQEQADKMLRSLKDKPKKEKKIRKQRKYTNRIPKKYSIYIKSIWWTKRKNKYYQKHKKICRACDSTNFIDLHHMLYKDFGHELDDTLVPLCRDCHKEFHDKYAVSSNLFEETYKFIETKKQKL